MISHGGNAICNPNEIDFKAQEKEFTLINCGYYSSINSYYNINVDSYMLLYQHKGEATINVNNVKYKIGPGTTVLLKPSNINVITYHKNPINERYYIYFNGYKVENLLKELNLGDEIIFKTGPRHNFADNIKEIIDDYSINKKFSLLGVSILLTLLAKTRYLADKFSSKSTASRIQPALDYMQENFASPALKIEEYAKMCFISPITLIKYFNKHTKMSPLQYFTSIKITNAQTQLVNSYKPISEIAESLSYVDPLYFCRVFKKFTGISPSAYRKLMVNNKIQ